MLLYAAAERHNGLIQEPDISLEPRLRCRSRISGCSEAADADFPISPLEAVQAVASDHPSSAAAHR